MSEQPPVDLQALADAWGLHIVTDGQNRYLSSFPLGEVVEDFILDPHPCPGCNGTGVVPTVAYA